MKKTLTIALIALMFLSSCGSGDTPARVAPLELDDAATIALLEQFVQWHEAVDIAWGKGQKVTIEVEFRQDGKVSDTGTVDLTGRELRSCQMAFAVMEQQVQGRPIFKAAVAQLDVGSSTYTFAADGKDLRGARFDIDGGEYGEAELAAGARVPLYGVFYGNGATLPENPDIATEAESAAAAVVFYLTIQ